MARIASLALIAALIFGASSTAFAGSALVRWAHEGANEFVIEYEPIEELDPEIVKINLSNIVPSQDGLYTTLISGLHENIAYRLWVVAVDGDGVRSPRSNSMNLLPAEFCGTGSCNDGVECTRDICAEEGCVNEPDEFRCFDLNVCTDDHCDASGGCFHTLNQANCDDGYDCTVNDRCSNGICRGTPSCPSDSYCDAFTGQCTPYSPTTTLPVSATCGNGIVEFGFEECDDGDLEYMPGDACLENCFLVDCGDTDGSGAVNIIDALYALLAALGQNECDPAVCNVDNTPTPTSASDALRLLRSAVGLPVELRCPPPE